MTARATMSCKALRCSKHKAACSARHESDESPRSDRKRRAAGLPSMEGLGSSNSWPSASDGRGRESRRRRLSRSLGAALLHVVPVRVERYRVQRREGRGAQRLTPSRCNEVLEGARSRSDSLSETRKRGRRLIAVRAGRRKPPAPAHAHLARPRPPGGRDLRARVPTRRRAPRGPDALLRGPVLRAKRGATRTPLPKCCAALKKRTATDGLRLSGASEPRSSAAGAPVTLTRRGSQAEILELRASSEAIGNFAL